MLATGVVGAITRNVDMTSSAILATSPKAVRTSCESFAATLGQGLADSHEVLPLRPDSLRRLDKIDTVVIDPRVLTGEQRRVVQIHGATEHELPQAWNNAQRLLDKPGLRPGWHRVRMTARDRAEAVEALILPTHHALASAVVLEVGPPARNWSPWTPTSSVSCAPVSTTSARRPAPVTSTGWTPHWLPP